MRDTTHRKQDSKALGHVVLDMSMFTPAAMQEEVAYELAVGILEGHLRNPAADREQVLTDILSTNNLLEFLISIMSHDTVSTLINWITDASPVPIEDFSSSLLSKLLSQFSRYFWELNYPSPGLQDRNIRVQLARTCLQHIPTLSFTEADAASGDSGGDIGLTVRQKSQREAKKQRAARNGRTITFDTKPFDDLSIDAPQSAAEAQEVMKRIMVEQAQILEEYFQVLRDPDLAGMFRKAYITANSTEPGNNAEQDSRNGRGAPIPGDHDNEFVQSPESHEAGAYPMVQPLKAALHFDTVEGFGDWHIHISSNAESDLRVMRKRNPVLFSIVMKKIKELSHGHFSRDNQKQLELGGSNIEIPIYEAKMTSDSRLVYQVDCVKEYGEEFERQVLRVFGVYTHTQMRRRFWEAVSYQLGSRGEAYRHRCTFRNSPHHTGDNVVSPALWPPRLEEAQTDNIRLPDLQDEDSAELHSLLVLDKIIPFSQAVLSGIMADQDSAPVYLLSPEEQEIVQHTSSCYVLGRSGTGKTTTMLFKIFGIERTWEQLRETFEGVVPRPRQIFVTQSRVLARKVEETYSKLSRMLVIERQSQEGASPVQERVQRAQGRELVDQDEEEDYHSSLPQSYKQLQDEHFPLFITYDQLCKLLEADLRSPSVQPMYSRGLDGEMSQQSPSRRIQLNRVLFVSYRLFLNGYWARFPQNTTRNFDPAIVFAEFMGVIKGSERALRTADGYLDRDSYQKLSRRIGTFSAERETVYNLFELYLKLKRRRGEYDAADRTYKIYNGLRTEGLPGRKVDFVYVDEVQDNLLTDSFILRSICHNPNGLFWAGDTAQTISAGSSFKFNELRAFQWRIERADTRSRIKDPKLFQLIKNYRSHGGIVNCARSVLELITQFWPDSIDQLMDETESIPGPKPTFFTGWAENPAQYEQFLFGAPAKHIEFGAHQCILVRDDLARKRLRSQVGDVGVILTLYESKGLEFNDVLLYNFFQDSTVDRAQWSVLLNALPQQPHHCPAFNKLRHGGVCRELKFLYVAITRARHNLWIADSSDNSEPMRALWEAHRLVQVSGVGDTTAQLATSSTSAEWEQLAYDLFQGQHYEQAARCYERASLPLERDIANAFLLREKATMLLPSQRTADSAQSYAFLTAARAFSACAAVADLKAVSYHRIAAECYAAGGDDRNAARAFLSALDFRSSAQHYRKAGLFDEAVQVVEGHAEDIPHETVESILTVAKVHYISKRKLKKAMRLFTTPEMALQFMEDYGFDDVRANVLESRQSFAEAAELHLAQGHVIEAISLFLQDSQDEHSRAKAQHCLLRGLWQALSFGVTVDMDCNSDSLLQPLLGLCEQFLVLPHTTGYFGDQLRMFQIIASGNFASLYVLGERFYTEHQDIPCTLLCLDHFYQRHLDIRATSCEEIASVLQVYLIYAREMQKIVLDERSCLKTDVQQLFGFQPSTEDRFLVLHGSFSSKHVSAISTPALTQENGLLVSTSDLRAGLQQAIINHLRSTVQVETYPRLEAPAFQPCVLFAVFGECKRRECSGHHIESHALDLQWYHSYIRIILLQMLIFQTINTFEPRRVQLEQRRYWLTTLYHAFYPPHRRLGSIATLNTAAIPEFERALPVVKEWIRDLFDHLHSCVPPHSFLTCVIEAAHLAFTFDKPAARHYLPRSRSVSACPSSILRREGGHYIVHDILNCLDGPDQFAISAGVLFFKHVHDESLAIDISVLCQILEHLCSSIILANRLQRSTTVHNVTLPSSWLLASSFGEEHRIRDIRLLSLLVETIPRVLEHVYQGTGNLSFAGKKLYYSGYQIRQLFIARICQSVSILSYNFPNLKARWDIFRAITSMNQPNRMFPRLYVQYALAEEPQELVRAMRGSEKKYGTPLDDLIQLKAESMLDGAGPIYTPYATHTVVFKEQPDIHRLLLERLSTAGVESISAQTVKPELSDAPDDEADEDEDINDSPISPLDDEQTEHHDEGPIDVDGATSLANAANTLNSVAPRTEAEITAATLIQTVYRCFRWHGRIKRSKLGEARERWFLQCLEASRSLGLNVKYRVLFLGPLPHILLCLEKANAYTREVKKQAVRELHTAEHSEYEHATERLNQATHAFKTTMRLQAILKPTSDLHRALGTAGPKKDATDSEKYIADLKLGRCIAELKKHVAEVKILIQDLPKGTMTHYAWDLEIGMKGIVREKTPAKTKKSKPELAGGWEDDLVVY